MHVDVQSEVPAEMSVMACRPTACTQVRNDRYSGCWTLETLLSVTEDLRTEWGPIGRLCPLAEGKSAGEVSSSWVQQQEQSLAWLVAHWVGRSYGWEQREAECQEFD